MRLEGKSKAGFYPTPPRVAELILDALIPDGTPAVLDPCAGEGDALLLAARRLKARAYGVELSRERAKKAASKGLRVHQGDTFTFRGEGFSLLWLNPPYDHGEGERLELSFLKHWTPALKPEGVLVYIIPESVLKDTETYLSSHYEVKGVWRFPEPEYQAFKQVVVLATRWQEPVPPHSLSIQGSLPASITLVVPGGYATLQRLSHLDEAEVLSALDKSPLFEEDGTEMQQPLLPLKNAHLALLLAGGLMDNQVVRFKGKPYLVRGEVRKVEVTLEETENGRTREITRERFQVQVVALGLLDGEILEVA